MGGVSTNGVEEGRRLPKLSSSGSLVAVAVGSGRDNRAVVFSLKYLVFSLVWLARKEVAQVNLLE